MEIEKHNVSVSICDDKHHTLHVCVIVFYSREKPALCVRHTISETHVVLSKIMTHNVVFRKL